MSDEIRSEIEALQDEQEQIENAHQDDEEYPPDVDERMAEIETRIEELNDQPGKYREEEIGLAGAIVSLGKPRTSGDLSWPRASRGQKESAGREVWQQRTTRAGGRRGR